MDLTRRDCAFFHVMDIPGEDPTPGSWDFRKTEAEYHAGYDLKGKCVLEIGAATGSHSFWMERQGAEVIPYDLSPDDDWDFMPAHNQDPKAVEAGMRTGMKRMNNAFNYCRDRLGSKLKLHHGTIYDISAKLGDFDVITYGSVLLHTRDPMGALQKAAKRTKTIMIMDRFSKSYDNEKPLAEFIPKMGLEKPWGGWTWWHASPKAYQNILEVLGFKTFRLETSKHRYVPVDHDVDIYTLVAER